jgi:hypothetical protein
VSARKLVTKGPRKSGVEQAATGSRTGNRARAKAPAKAKPAAKPKPTRRKAAAKTTRPARKPAAKAKPARRKTPARKPASMRQLHTPAVTAVERDLKWMPADVAKSAEAAAALAMASRLDSGDGSPSECAKALLAAMGKLREMCPPDTKKGELHDIKSGRASRLAAGSPAG